MDIAGAGSWIFSENRGYISISSRTALTTTWGFFFIWHNFYEGSMSMDRNIRIFPCVRSNRFSVLLHKTLLFEKRKRRFVYNMHGNGFLGSFENHGYLCFRTSLADPVIWRHFQ